MAVQMERLSEEDDGGDGDVASLIHVVNKNRRLKRSVCLLTVVVLASTVACFVLGVVRLGGNTQKVCQTDACVAFAADLTASMNTSADPCQDFFEYACGNWKKTHIVTEKEKLFGRFDMAKHSTQKQVTKVLEAAVEDSDPTAVALAKEFFASCKDKQQMETVKPTLVLDYLSRLAPEDLSVQTFLQTYLDAARHSDPFFAIHIAYGPQTDKMKRLEIRPAGTDLGLDADADAEEGEEEERSSHSRNGKRRFFAREDGHDKVPPKVKTEAYRRFLSSALRALNRTQAQADGVFAIELAIGVALGLVNGTGAVNATAEDPEPATMTLAQLNSLVNDTRLLDFVALARGVVNDDDEAARQITNATKVVVANPAYMTRVAALIRSCLANRTRRDHLAAYLFWLPLKGLSPFLGRPLRTYAAVYAEARGKEALASMPRACERLTTRTLPAVVSRMYVDAFLDDKAIATMLTVYKNLKTELKLAFDTLDWADARSKELLKGKVDALTTYIGYQQSIKNDNFLDAPYRDLDLDFSCFSCSLFQLLAANKAWKLQGLFVPRTTEDEPVPSTLVNAYYDPDYNFLVLPAAVLQKPFYSPQFGQLQLYSLIAASIAGHEMGHAFDNFGIQYDSHGMRRPWLSNATMANFRQHASCIVDQYNAYTFKGERINGSTTLGENIADFVGFHAGYRAYKRLRAGAAGDGSSPSRLPGLARFSDDQIFFLSFGSNYCAKATSSVAEGLADDPHSPDPLRSYGTMAHSAEFARAFRCRRGTPMNPARQCRLWF